MPAVVVWRRFFGCRRRRLRCRFRRFRHRLLRHCRGRFRFRWRCRGAYGSCRRDGRSRSWIVSRWRLRRRRRGLSGRRGYGLSRIAGRTTALRRHSAGSLLLVPFAGRRHRGAAFGLERNQPDKRHVEAHLGVRRELQVAQTQERDLVVELQVFGGERRGEALVLRVRWLCAEFLGDGQIVERALQLAEHRRQIHRSGNKIVAHLQQPCSVVGRQRIEQRVDFVAPGDAEHVVHARRADLAAAVRNGLVGDGERVAHGTCRGLGNRLQGGWLGGDVLRLQHLRQLRLDRLRQHVAQVELQAARQHGDGNLLGFGGGEQELDVLRRLLQRFQQGVEAVPGEHVDFVDQIDLEAALAGQELGVVEQLAGVLHAGARGGIDFDEIHEAPGGDLGAGAARAAGLRGDAAFAVEAGG